MAMVSAQAKRFSYKFNDTPVSEALIRISREHPETDINFIYAELEGYRTSARIDTDDVREAIRLAVGMNPVSVIAKKNRFYLEARHQGENRYTGQAVGTDGSPVVGAAVMLLSAADSTVVTYGVTDEIGRFSIPSDRRDVTVKASALGYMSRHMAPTGFSVGKIVLTAKPIELNSVKVEADKAFVTSDRTIFLPTKREKNAASGGADLLLTMAIPTLKVHPMDKSITTMDGEGVSVFIDFLPADVKDVANLRTQDVNRVEVYDYPVDPRFNGALHAVNFVMVKYEYGGYTKISGDQKFVTPTGDYNVNSKFTYRKMTYDLAAGSDFMRSTREGVERTSVFGFTDGEIERTERTESSLARNNSEYVSVRANYSTDRMVVSNTAGLNYQCNPGSHSAIQTDYSSRYESGLSARNRKMKNLSPYWNGSFHLSMPKGFSLAVTPDASYARNTSDYGYDSDNGTVVNDVTEDVWGVNLSADLSKRIRNHTLSFSLRGELQRNELTYSGTNPATVNHSNEAVGGFLRANFRFGKVWVQPSVKYFFAHTSFGGKSYYEHLPGYYISTGWNFSRKSSVMLSSEMSNWTIPVSQRSPNIVIRNPLEAVKGDPEQTAFRYNAVTLRYQWYPVNKFMFSAFGKFFNFDRPIINSYEPTVIDGKEMMLITPDRNGNLANTDIGMSGTLRLFDNSLSLNATLKESFVNRAGKGRFSDNFFNASFQFTYYLKDFFFMGYYSLKSRGASSGYRLTETPSYLHLQAGWSRNALNISVVATNPFTSGWESTRTVMDVPNFRECSVSTGGSYHREFSLRVTYSFSYGKKVDSSDELGRGAGMESGIVN